MSLNNYDVDKAATERGHLERASKAMYVDHG
jgi:hypothetical protein